MFDLETAALIKQAPKLRETNPENLVAELTSIYAEISGLRLRNQEPLSDEEFSEKYERLLRIATTYEAVVDTGATGNVRRAAAFVAATTFQVLGKLHTHVDSENVDLLSSSHIHPFLAAPLLFLIAEQNPDARESVRPLRRLKSGDIVSRALIETIHDLGAEDYLAILKRAERLADLELKDASENLSEAATQALYGMCWAGITQMVAKLLQLPEPDSIFSTFSTPQQTFKKVIELSSVDVTLPASEAKLLSQYAGPRHLAVLLISVADSLEEIGIVNLPAPSKSEKNLWESWLRYRAETKPILWPNHKQAIDKGFLIPEQSCVLVLPTGAGKTTLSEFKIAATLARGLKTIFLVPTLSLVDQLRNEFEKSFPENLFADIEVSSNGDIASLTDGIELKSIEVMTPERCLALLSFGKVDFSKVGLVVFDECHLLCETGGGRRSVDAMLCLLQLMSKIPNADLLLLSAMLKNGNEVAEWLQSSTNKSCLFIEAPWKPSRQARGVIIYPDKEIKEIKKIVLAKKAAAQKEQKYKVPELLASPYALFGLKNNWNENSSDDIRLVNVSEEKHILALGQYGATPNANKVAVSLAKAAASAGLKTIVFVQVANHAPSTAAQLAPQLDGVTSLTSTEEVFWEDIQSELGGKEYSLIDPHASALPHNGDMLSAERQLAESLFRRHDGINVIIATPTLAQGMNLPAQLAILAGNMRHDEAGRAELESHEILNAAGRAGRAGYLANGTVLLIPEPVISFNASQEPSAKAFSKLRSLLPENDQCIIIDDPLTNLLDKIQAGEASDSAVQYFLSRLHNDEVDTKNEATTALMNKSLGAFLAKKASNQILYDQKVDALKQALQSKTDQIEVSAMSIAALTGINPYALEAMRLLLIEQEPNLPSSIVEWSDWLIDFIFSDGEILKTLLEHDVGTLKYVLRGSKSKEEFSTEEITKLKHALRKWLTGEPFCEIEKALGVEISKIGVCARSRDLVLKIINRKLYMLAAAAAELTNSVLDSLNLKYTKQPVLEILSLAMRQGFDSPEKVAFAHLNKSLKTRVRIHETFKAKFKGSQATQAQTFLEVLNYVEAISMFSNIDLEDE